MTFSIRIAKLSEAKPLVGLYAESGCGKTYSALLLARGFVGQQGRIVMIDTESGRGEAYADLLLGGYDVIAMRGDFSPTRYGEALTVAEQADIGALIIDSASHEWEGAGGVLDMAAQNQAAGKSGPLVWQQPKMLHQRHFMLRLLATPIPLVIVCMRAKFPMQERKKPDGKKEWIRSERLEPIQASDILYEMFVHAWIDQHHRLRVTKLTRPDLAQVFRDGELVTIDTGKRLAEWAKGSIPHKSESTVDAASVEPGCDVSTAHPTPSQPGPLFDDEPSSEEVLAVDLALTEAAKKGVAELEKTWKGAPRKIQKTLKAALDRRHKPAAQEVDAAQAATMRSEER